MIDLSIPIRSFILADASISALLPAYQNSKPVFTRRPIPTDAKWPVVIVNPQVGGGIDSDYLKSFQREVAYDISVYGTNDTPANYRLVEQIGFALQARFHRRFWKEFVTPNGWQLVRMKSYGPMSAPVDDVKHVGRLITVQFLITQDTA